MNGKAKRHIQTVCNGLRLKLCNSGIPTYLWRFAAEDVSEIYGDIIHFVTKESPLYVWSGTKIPLTQ